MKTSYVTHEEATIQSYMRDPEFAEYMLNEAITTGDIDEIRKIQRRIAEARSRTRENQYWSSLIEHAERTAESGKNLEAVIGLVRAALEILKSASSKSAVTPC